MTARCAGRRDGYKEIDILDPRAGTAGPDGPVAVASGDEVASFRLAMSDERKIHAVGQTAIKSYQPTVFDEVPGAPTLSDIRLTETFSGDIEGDGVAHVVQAARADGAASFAGIERVRGSIGGKQGSFLLQVHGTVVRKEMKKEMKAEWIVVPGSGTGELTGLRGDGGFTAELGQHGSIWLDYQIEAP
jgi:hypothetical protein